MSKINVWTSDGEWSKEVEGLDKIHLMKKTIFVVAEPFDVFDEPFSFPWKNFEINSEAFCYVPEMGEEKAGLEPYYFWCYFNKANGKDMIPKAKTFKLPIAALKKVIKNDLLCAPLFDELIAAAKVPVTASEDYCLLFKFEDE